MYFVPSLVKPEMSESFVSPLVVCSVVKDPPDHLRIWASPPVPTALRPPISQSVDGFAS